MGTDRGANGEGGTGDCEVHTYKTFGSQRRQGVGGGSENEPRGKDSDSPLNP